MTSDLQNHKIDHFAKKTTCRPFGCVICGFRCLYMEWFYIMLLLCIGTTEWFHVTLKRELTTPVHCRRHQGISKDEQLIQREFFNLGQGHQGCRCLSQDSNILQQSVWSGLMGDGCFQMIRTFEDTMQHDVADSWGLKEAYGFFSWSHGVVFSMDTVKMCQLRFAKDCQQNTSTSGAKPARSDWLKMAKDSSRVESLKMTTSEGAGVERRKMFQKFCLQNFQLARERDGKKGALENHMTFLWSSSNLLWPYMAIKNHHAVFGRFSLHIFSKPS